LQAAVAQLPVEVKATPGLDTVAYDPIEKSLSVAANLPPPATELIRELLTKLRKSAK
jgi:hypothetical protein